MSGSDIAMSDSERDSNMVASDSDSNTSANSCPLDESPEEGQVSGVSVSSDPEEEGPSSSASSPQPRRRNPVEGRRRNPVLKRWSSYGQFGSVIPFKNI